MALCQEKISPNSEHGKVTFWAKKISQSYATFWAKKILSAKCLVYKTKGL